MTTLSDKLTRGTVPLSNLPERTVWVDENVVSVSNNNGGTLAYANFRAERDSNGRYWLEYFYRLTGASTGSTHITTLGGVDFDGNAPGTQAESGSALVYTSGSTVVLSSTGSVVMAWGRSPLTGKPTWFDANREAGFSINAQVEAGTSTTAGLAKIIDEDDLSTDSDSHVPTQQSVKAYVDNAVESGTWSPTTASTSGTVGTIGYGQAFYMRVGNVVTCALIITTTGWGEGGRVRVTLPVIRATNFPDAWYASGTGEGDVAAPTGSFIVVAQSGAKNVDIHNQYPGSTNGNIHLHFSYRLD